MYKARNFAKSGFDCGQDKLSLIDKQIVESSQVFTLRTFTSDSHPPLLSQAILIGAA